MIVFTQKGDLSKTTKFLEKASKSIDIGILEKYGERGVRLLEQATPKDTGKTAGSWSYEIEQSENRTTLSFHNTNIINDWFHLAIALQYGHGTRNGGWVEGIDYINPAMRPIFEDLAKEVWEEVTK